mmetsp:Transcript_16428/g.29653  ORF Transcript_16428/g.29653 Transcript_16428/m.29653 type:complete len:275 (-) Transcript_16428:533-1357(-)
MLGNISIPLGVQGADGGGGGVEDADLILVDDLPAATGIGIGRHALEDDLGGPEEKRAVGDVRVTRDPTAIGSAPVHVGLRLNVEDVLGGEGGTDHVPASAVLDALGLAGRPGGVELEERVLGLDPGDGALIGEVGNGVLEPEIASFTHGDIGAIRFSGLMVQNKDIRDNDGFVGVLAIGVGAHVEGGIDNGLEEDGLGTTLARTGSDDELGLAVPDATGKGFVREATEDDGVNGTNAGTSKHDGGELGDKGHVDGHIITLADAEALQVVGKLAD